MDRVSVSGHSKVLEIKNDDSCTTLQIYYSSKHTICWNATQDSVSLHGMKAYRERSLTTTELI